jgi:hypothetical protein
MRQARTLLIGLVLTAAAGCTTSAQPNSPAWMNRFRSLWAGLGPDALQAEIALVQQPLDNPYLSFDVWREIDEQVVPLERRPLLESNGFRLGTISGTVPSELQRVLTTERLTCVQGHTWEISGSENDGTNPTCPHCQLRPVKKESFVTARRKGVKPNDPTFQALGPDKVLRVQVHQDGSATPLELEAAQAGLSIQFKLSDDGEVVVHCEPRVQYGSALRIPHPSDDKSGWSFTTGRPEKEFSKLAWEVTLRPSEYLVIGAWHDRADTLGQRCFLQQDAGLQSLLLIRVARPQTPDPKATAVASASAKPVNAAGPLPLALQSIMPKRPAPTPALTRSQSAE